MRAISRDVIGCNRYSKQRILFSENLQFTKFKVKTVKIHWSLKVKCEILIVFYLMSSM